jgi:uncharacterized membrane protein YphA (DoxX/SURF4 family)
LFSDELRRPAAIQRTPELRLLSPAFAGDPPLPTSRYSIGFGAVLAIVALRIGIGIHFFGEGLNKLRNPKPFSAMFFGGAKGPLAPIYKGLVWDAEGYARLDADAAGAMWDRYGEQVAAHYRFTDKQRQQVERIVKNYKSQLKNYLGGHAEEIDEYYSQVDRRNKNQQDKARMSLASFRVHDAKIDADRLKLWGQIMPGIDAMWKGLDRDLNALATEDQYRAHGRLSISKPGRRVLDSEAMDAFIPYFDLAIGVCLVLGLFVRPAAILGGLFLLSVCLSQWPWAPGAMPIYYQAIEMLALFALAAIGAGQVAGLDALLEPFWAAAFRRREAAPRIAPAR